MNGLEDYHKWNQQKIFKRIEIIVPVIVAILCLIIFLMGWLFINHIMVFNIVVCMIGVLFFYKIGNFLLDILE